ncbi:MAG: hypothetical protein ABIC40_00635, partial [bacterium]
MTEFDSNKNGNETNEPHGEGDKSYSKFRPPWDVSKPRETPHEKTETIIAENLSTGPEIADAMEREIYPDLPLPFGPVFGDMA